MAFQMPFISLMIFIIISGNFQTYAVTYDHRFTHECLRKPMKPQYGGGIAVNPKLNKGMKGWTEAKVESKNGNKYIVASVAGNRTSTLQEFHLDKDKLYAFSAWLQVRQGNVYIGAFFKTQTITKTAGWVAAQEGCWSMLKGGLVVNASGPAHLYFEGHFSELNLPYLRASIDVLNSANLPIWITELDVANKTWPNQAKYLEQILRELHAHKAVQGIIIWGGWWPNQGCWRMCLTDDNFKNLATGDVVDKIMAEWTHAGGLKATTDAHGHFQTSLFHGQYEAQITHPKLAKLDSNLEKFEVFPNGHKAQHVVLNCGKGC